MMATAWVATFYDVQRRRTSTFGPQYRAAFVRHDERDARDGEVVRLALAEHDAGLGVRVEEALQVFGVLDGDDGPAGVEAQAGLPSFETIEGEGLFRSRRRVGQPARDLRCRPSLVDHRKAGGNDRGISADQGRDERQPEGRRLPA